MLPYEAKLSALGNGGLEGEIQRTLNGWVAALIGAHGRGDGHGLAVHRPDRPALRGGEYSPKKWQKGRFPASAGVGAIL